MIADRALIDDSMRVFLNKVKEERRKFHRKRLKDEALNSGEYAYTRLGLWYETEKAVEKDIWNMQHPGKAFPPTLAELIMRDHFDPRTINGFNKPELITDEIKSMMDALDRAFGQEPTRRYNINY